MIDFLKEIDISNNTISKIITENQESSLYNLSCNKDNCIKIILYMREIGIKNIEELLIYETNYFKLTFTEFIKKISRFNIPLLVDGINNDYTYIELLDE